MTNVLFNGNLPRWLGFDKEVSYFGAHDTVAQCTQFKPIGKKDKTVVASWRYVSDMGTDDSHTALIGGVSGRRLSSFYTLGIDAWMNCELKTLHGKD